MTRLTRNLWRGGALLLLLAAALLAWAWWQGAGKAAAPGSSYQTAVVRRGDLELTVSSTGTLAAVETVAVGTEVSGTVAKVLVDYNDRVTKGQMLAVLKPDLFAAAVADAQGAVAQASATLDLAQQELERNRPLFDQGYLSAQEFLPYRINVEKATAALASARAGLTRARTNLGNATIRSPIAGTVIQRSVDAGQTVAASLNTPTLFVIARDLAKMQIEAAVDETDIGQLRPGQPVRFSVQSYPERNFNGQVRQVRLQPTTVQNVVTYTVIVAADNEQGLLLPGMTATVDFIVARARNTLLVPSAALRFHPEKTAKAAAAKQQRPPAEDRIFVLEPTGSLHPLAVTVGLSDGQTTEVEGAGVAEGLLVVSGEKPGDAKPKGGFSLFGAMRGRPRR